MQFISRVEGGWNVRMMRGGKRHARFFADSRYGGQRKALAAAKACRDEWLEIRVAETKPRPARPLLVVRGKARYYQIRLPRSGGRTTTTEFSLHRHGPRQAKKLAIQAYNEATLAAS